MPFISEPCIWVTDSMIFTPSSRQKQRDEPFVLDPISYNKIGI
jgi:hypothetical protein